jgi:class 3 adenylate cyclase
MEPQIRYARTSDGVSVAYWTMGEGGVPLIMSPPLGWSHISLELSNPELASWYERLASKRVLVRYDPRNHGLSDRGVDRLSPADQAADVEAVIERLGLSQVDLLASATPGAPMLAVAAECRDMIRRLVLWNIDVDGEASFANPVPRRSEGSANPIGCSSRKPSRVRCSVGRGTKHTSGLASCAAPSVRRTRPFSSPSTPESTGAPGSSASSVPTLVIHDSTYQPWDDSIPARIPDSRLVQLNSPERTPYRNEAATRAIEQFLDEGQPPSTSAAPHSGTAIILFTDIVDSTALTERMGDVAFRDASRALDALLRAAIREAGGAAIDGKLLGDGVLATFPSAAQAIDGARRCLALSAASELGLHIGLHAGDVIREDNNVYGGAVNIASRICVLSAPGEILVSDVVRGMARSSAGVTFEERGEQEMKGVGEPVRVYAVRGAE